MSSAPFQHETTRSGLICNQGGVDRIRNRVQDFVVSHSAEHEGGGVRLMGTRP